MATNITRYNRPTAVPLRSVMDQLFADSFFAPTLLENGWKNGSPVPANILNTADSYVVQMAVPGIDAGKLHVETTGAELRVSGSYSINKPEDSSYVIQALPTGEFNYTVTLPSEVQGDGAEASYQRRYSVNDATQGRARKGQVHQS